MSSPAARSEASSTRVLVLDTERFHDVFEVLGTSEDETVLRVQSAYLFELGEELTLRIEKAGQVSDAVARVRAHVGPADAQVTELEIVQRSEPRHMVTG